MVRNPAMLNAAVASGQPVPVARLASSQESLARYGTIDWETPIDRTRWFLPEPLTPLFYTGCYDRLGATDRLRYNQLTGMLSNEIILFLESRFLAGVLRRLPRSRRVREVDGLSLAIAEFDEDERRHVNIWRRLNRLCEPGWYADTDHWLMRSPPAIGVIARFIARHPIAFPVVLWVQLAQEERSIEISRRCLQEPPGRLEPRFATAYRLHLHDEIRHVQLDWHLIDRCYRGRSTTVRRVTAALLRKLIGTVLLVPVYSTTRVLEVLVSERTHLREMMPEMLGQLRGLCQSNEYQRMMYSRAATPVIFELFDRFPEFKSMQQVLRTYRPTEQRGS